MLFENTEVFNFEGAIRGMRNPKESWKLSDSKYCDIEGSEQDLEKILKGDYYNISPKDLQLMQTLIKAGSEHRKFMRQIFVSVDITAPLYWWKEFDTYKVATVSNSCSTMHKLADTPITLDCFECAEMLLPGMVEELEKLRQQYNETKDKTIWKKLIVNLPESWLQKRTVTMNYENLLGICSKGQRRFHKLTEWSVNFIQWARNLPYAQDLLFIDELSK